MKSRGWIRLVRLVSAFVLGAIWLVSCAPAASPPSATQAPAKSEASAQQPAAPAGLTRIEVQQSFVPDSVWVYVNIAIDKGFFKDAGLDVVQREGTGSVNAVTAVATGKLPIGIADAGSLLVGRSQGLEVTSLAAVYQDTPIGILTKKGSGVKSAKDLIGKTVGEDTASSTYVMFLAAMKQAGVDPGQIKVNNVAISSKVASFKAGQYDAMPGYGNIDPHLLASQGTEVDVLWFKDLGLNIYGHVVFVQDDFLKKNPDVVKRFMAALAKGFDYANKNRDESVDLLQKKYPAVNSTVLSNQLKSNEPIIWNQDAREKGWGFQREDKWSNLQKILLDHQIQKTPVEIGKVFTNEYLPKP